MKWYETINEAGIEEIADKTGMKPKPKNTFQCPSCGAMTRGSSDGRGPVGATANRKGWLCHRCGATGSLLDFVSYHLTGSKYKELDRDQRRGVYEWGQSAGYSDGDAPRKPKHEVKDTLAALGRKKQSPSVSAPAQGSGGVFAWGSEKPQQYKETLWDTAGESVRDYLIRERKLSEEVIKEADLGAMRAQGMDWIVIPLKNTSGEIVNMRFRSIPPEGQKKSYRVCPSRPMPLYGSDRLAKTFDDMVILCEGELDVLAMKTLGYDANVVSTTTGASSFAEEWLDQLEPFRSFWLFYDNDQAGNDGAKKVAEKLGKYRCMRVKLPAHNDVGEVLQSGADPILVDEAFNNAKSYVDSELKSVLDYADELERLIAQPDTMRGRSTGSMRLDACCGGVTAGLWVITGDTGQGKTSWATWMCWEMARLGTPIMLTSFEQSPIGTVQKLLRNQLGGDFTKYTPDERRAAIIELDNLPIRILDHYGNADVDTVIESVRYSSRRHGTKIALIDHLHFLIKPSGDERNEIETVVRKLATLAVQDQITIFLICHPNNMAAAQQRRVKITDLKGASAIRQDAHVAVVVERGVPSPKRGYPHSVIYFDKVRSEFGQAGSKCVMAYDPLSCVYADRWEDTPAGMQGVKVISAPE